MIFYKRRLTAHGQKCKEKKFLTLNTKKYLEFDKELIAPIHTNTLSFSHNVERQYLRSSK